MDAQQVAHTELVQIPVTTTKRLLSLDFMRGFIMVFLALEGTRIYFELDAATKA